MTTKKQRDWLTPLDIPEGKAGKYRVEKFIIPAGQKVMLNNARNIILGGQKAEAANLVYDVDTTWHRLVGPTGVWIQDIPVEQRQMEECIKKMKGRVLVGGLGLGLAATLLAKRKTVKHITVVEVSKEVIRLMEPSIHHPKIEVVCDDLFTFLERLPEKNPYNTSFYDIWQSDSENTFHKIVVPLIQLSRGKVQHTPINWNESVMRGQLWQGLQGRLLLFKLGGIDEKEKKYIDLLTAPEKTGDVWIDWQRSFWPWWKKAQPDDELAQHMAQTYANLYGLWDWETAWKSVTEG